MDILPWKNPDKSFCKDIFSPVPPRAGGQVYLKYAANASGYSFLECFKMGRMFFLIPVISFKYEMIQAKLFFPSTVFQILRESLLGCGSRLAFLCIRLKLHFEFRQIL